MYEKFEGLNLYTHLIPVTVHTQLNHLGCLCLILLKEEKTRSSGALNPCSDPLGIHDSPECKEISRGCPGLMGLDSELPQPERY